MSGLDPWELRIEAAQEALSRNRFSFLAATIVSIAFMMATYNQALSWDRMALLSTSSEFGRQLEDESLQCFERSLDERKTNNSNQLKTRIKPCLEKYFKDQLSYDERFKRWQKNFVVSNNLLGISLSGDDILMVGGLIIIVLLTWSFYNSRRENHLIFHLVKDSLKIDDDATGSTIREAIFFGVASHTVFITLTDNHSARRVDYDITPDISNGRLHIGESKLIFWLAPILLNFIAYAPLFALCFSLIIQLATAFVKSPSRSCPIKDDIINNYYHLEEFILRMIPQNLLVYARDKCIIFLDFEWNERLWFYIAVLLMTVSIFICYILCKQIHAFHDATKENLNILRSKIPGLLED